jgi:drug/metabolite transporter (DMT)-like permease
MNRRGALLFAAMCVIWGVPYLMIRVAVRELAPVTLVFGRTVIAALLLTPVALYRGHLRPLLRFWPALLAYTAVEVAIPWVLLARAETKLTSSLTGLLIAGVPLVGAVIVRISGDRERMGARRWLGLLVGLLGVAALVGLDLGSVSALPVAEVGTVAVCYAIGPIILSRSLADVPALGVVAGSLGLAALAYAPVGIAQAPGSVPRVSVLLSVAGLGVICTALGFLIFLALIADVGPVRATVITYVNPVVAGLLGVTILSEKITAGMGVGLVLVLVGCFLATGATRAVAEP